MNDQHYSKSIRGCSFLRNESGRIRTITTIILVFGFVVLILGGYVIKEIFDRVDDATEKVIDVTKKIIDEFKTDKITYDFHTYGVTKLKGTNRLQVATVNAMELFKSNRDTSYIWGLLKFSAGVTITAPVEYTYYLDLNDRWKFLITDEGTAEAPMLKVFVLAPPIQYNTPAIIVSKWTIQDDKRSYFIDQDELREKLRQELVNICQEMAKERIQDNILRATIRTEVKNFIQTWFIENRFKDDKHKPMVAEVYFEDEALPHPVPDLLKNSEIKVIGEKTSQ